jgi:hypothetical protein
MKLTLNHKMRPRSHLKMIRGSLHQESRTVADIYTPNIGAPKYIK